MIWKEPIVGKYVTLKYARIEDAEFILEIRQDPNLTRFLPRLDITIERQENWLRKQQNSKDDYYFIVWRNDGTALGTIRVYDIKEDEGETGSIAIKGSIAEKLEAKVLMDTFIFETLGLNRIHNIVRVDNTPIINFSEMFGVQWNGTAIDRTGHLSLTGFNTRDRSREYRCKIAKELYCLNYNKNTGRHKIESASEVKTRLKMLLSDILPGLGENGSEKIIDNNLVDSLTLVTIVTSIEDKFHCKIPFGLVNAERFNNLDSITELILEQQNSEAVSGWEDKDEANRKFLEWNALNTDLSQTKKSVVRLLFEYSVSNSTDAAIIVNDRETTYGQLASMIWSISRWMLKKGISNGDCVTVQAIHNEVCIASYYAIHLIGAILVPTEKSASLRRINEIATETKSKLIISNEYGDSDIVWVNYSKVKEIADRSKAISIHDIVFPDLDAPCEMVFTTGTTGKSKGVLMTHRHISWYAYAVAKCVEMKKGNRFFITTPLNHAGGLRRTHLSLGNGCCAVYLDGLSDIGKYYSYIEKYKVTSLYLPPAAIRILLTRTGNELSRFKNQIDFVYSSSSPLPIGDCQRLRKLLPYSRLYNAYEASETPGVSAYNYNRDDIGNNCMGLANEGVELGILKDDKILQENHIEGQICVRSKMNMKEYYQEPGLTKTVWRDDWFVSNDIGFLDEEGNVYYLGRKGDVINLGGYKIAPTDVEEIALLSGMINECILIESKDQFNVPYLELLIVVDTGKDFNSDVLVSFLAARLEAYKIPRKITIVDEIKKTFNGKINRKAYRYTHER